MIFLTKLIFQFPLDGFLFSFPNYNPQNEMFAERKTK